jgi:hypothetical protein
MCETHELVRRGDISDQLVSSRSLRQRIKRYLPNNVISRTLRWQNTVIGLRNMSGRFPRECPICAFSGYFASTGTQPIIIDWLRPKCRSVGRHRHRQHHLLMKRHSDWIDGRDVLHVAPEPCLVEAYARRARHYVRGDYFRFLAV